jgi:hypothetical protein
MVVMNHCSRFTSLLDVHIYVDREGIIPEKKTLKLSERRSRTQSAPGTTARRDVPPEGGNASSSLRSQQSES